MAGLVPAIHVFDALIKTWMRATSAGITSEEPRLSESYFEPSDFGGLEVYVPASGPDPTCTKPNLSGFLTTSPTPATNPNAAPARRPTHKPISTACDVLICMTFWRHTDAVRFGEITLGSSLPINRFAVRLSSIVTFSLTLSLNMIQDLHLAQFVRGLSAEGTPREGARAVPAGRAIHSPRRRLGNSPGRPRRRSARSWLPGWRTELNPLALP
jgi:hypothetical protein